MNNDALKDQFSRFKGMVYADWTGAAQAPKTLERRLYKYLCHTPLGNPHSLHAASMNATKAIESARRAILQYFNASEEYDVIFTKNATEATGILRHFQFQDGELLLSADDHNSVNGLRELMRGKTLYTPIRSDLTIDEEKLLNRLAHRKPHGNSLFCYPAKSNASGVLHSLQWVSRAQALGWSVLLDAAAFMANDRLDLSNIKPDFVPISFYKMYGMTGVGCLLIRRDAYKLLHKEWFAGGTVEFVSIAGNCFRPKKAGHELYEEGTLNFNQIPGVTFGLKFLEDLGETKGHATSLAQQLYDGLSTMRAGRGSIAISSPRGTDIVNFSVKKGRELIPPEKFGEWAAKRNICVRTGCFCNPGVNEAIFPEPKDRARMGCAGAIGDSGDPPVLGGIRASFGYANTEEDVEKFLDHTKKFLGAL